MAKSMHNGTDTCVGLSAVITSYRDVKTVTMSGMSISLSFCARSPCESNCSNAVERLNMSTANEAPIINEMKLRASSFENFKTIIISSPVLGKVKYPLVDSLTRYSLCDNEDIK